MSGSWSFLAFDHSRAWLSTKWPLPGAPISASIVTRTNFRWINDFVGGMLDKQEFLFVLNKLREVPVSYVSQILQYEHTTWLNEIEKDDILRYWQSPYFCLWLDRIEEGLNNGQYV